MRNFAADIKPLLSSDQPDQLQQALSLVKEWTHEEPSNPLAFLFAGDVFKRLGQKEKSIQSYMLAAQEYEKKSKPIQRIAVLKLVLELDPNHQGVRDELKRVATAHVSATVGTLPKIPLFSSLPIEALARLITLMGRRSFAVDDYICRQGDVGDSIFILSQGQVRICTEPGPGVIRDLARLEEGAFFGEMAYFTDRTRKAHVVAATPCEVLEIKRATLERMVAEFPEIDGILQEFYHQRLLDMQLAQSPIFLPLPPEARLFLAQQFTAKDVKENFPILVEGDPGDTFYFILEGEVEVYHEKLGKKIPLATLPAGEFFGELALLNGHRRLATVRSTKPCRLLLLKRDQVISLFEKFPEIQRELENIARVRTEVTRKISTNPTPGV